MDHNGNPTVTHHQYIIIGAGPAGLQLGYYLEKAGRDYLILEAGAAAGTFFNTFPRHRMLISHNKIYTGYDDPEVNLRWDWNSLLSDDEEMLLKRYTRSFFPSADDMVRYLGDFARRFGLNIKYKTRAASISRDGEFSITDEGGDAYTCARLIIATGFSRLYLPEVPGIELAEKYTEVSVDPEEFVNQRVLIIGKGNSGFETAENLVGTAAVIHLASPRAVSLAWKTHFVGHLRAVNNNILDTYQLKSQNAVIDATVERISRRDDGKYLVTFNYTHAHGEVEEIAYDRVIACTGFGFDGSIFEEGSRPEVVIDGRFPAQTCEWESANVEDLYFAGTLTQVRDYKKATSGFIHGFRYNVRALHRICEQKYHGNPWPYREAVADPDAATDLVIRRVNKSSALWQQFGFLCDLIVRSEDGRGLRYYEEMPLACVTETELGRNEHYYTVTLEFGKIEGDPFNIIRHPSADTAEQSTFLHPIIRHFAAGRLVSEHHVLEDLYGEWMKPDVHVRPLREFFARSLDRVPARAGRPEGYEPANAAD
jgi:thioredoxin reductase